jgi:hypothetical protein
MFEKKLDKIDLEELREREKLIQSLKLITQALQTQKQLFISSRYSKYRMDENKVYDIELKAGKIKEVKNPPTMMPRQ